jgi:DNA-directed RNA polymerase specialized sigma24 family protein
MKTCLQENRIEECARNEFLHQATVSETRLLRYCGLLGFVASRVLDGPDEIAAAVERCFRTASRYPMGFEYEGEFRNWLVRILLDEALEIRSRKLFRPEGALRRTAEYWSISMQEGDPR